MDRIPTPGGGAPDGAFERFLTAALATIITIMFSWRLLAEEEEASGATGSTSGQNTPFQFSSNRNLDFYDKSPQKPKLTAARVGIRDIDIDLSVDESRSVNSRSESDFNNTPDQIDIVYDRHEPVQSHPLEAIPAPDDSISSILSADDSLTADTLTTWDEYKWEEETGKEEPCVIKTRRSVRDFVTSPNASLNLSNNQSRCEVIEPQSLSLSYGASPVNENGFNHSVPFSQRFANFEYKDTGGDSGYIDLYPDVESDDDTDSSDDEHVYEIQVSDSDSDSDSERGGAFFGVTALDTIMEEYESDDHGEAGYDVIPREGGRCYGPEFEVTNLIEKDLSVTCETICDRNDNTELSQSGEKEKHFSNSESLQNVANNDNKTDSITEAGMLLHTPAVNAKRQFPQNQTTLKPSEVDGFENNLSHEVSDNKISRVTNPSLVSHNVTVCDLNINQESTENSSLTESNANLRSSDINQGGQTCKSNDISVKEQSTVPLKQAPENSKEKMKLKLSGDDYKISEISDDSLPPSPVRTCALDNLNEEPFSDTESIGSGSVITVISVKSNDSDPYSDRFETKRNPPNNTQTFSDDAASGRRDLSTLINDQNTELGKYENFSLVSGFLNDSLNSLLSANTGSIENSDAESSSGKENTEQEIVNGKVASDESSMSSAESLPVVGEIIHPVAQISENGHIDSQDSLNTSSNPNLNEQDQDDQSQPREYHFSDSDNSSEESDPPLREYDPHDDDLAAYQFNFDSDEDSFFLVIGDDRNSNSDDEGKLRNFETFTNLNSVGLSPEYGDAVTSHTLRDDARGFKFSHTEDVSTEFRRRSYFTDRSNLSDSETRSDAPLSPVISEDEELKLPRRTESAERIELAERTEQPITEHRTPPSKLPNLSKYADAEISTTSGHMNENESNKSDKSEKIDFKKYIINSELSPISEHVSFPESDRSSSVNTDLSKINTYNRESKIDGLSDKTNTYSEHDLNNLQILDGQEETLSSLTEKIERLTQFESTGDLDKLRSENFESEFDANLSENKNTVASEIGELNTTKIETNIDDIFKDNNSPRTHLRIETNIDDVLNDVTVPDSKLLNKHKAHATPTKSKVETNIDDLFDEDVKKAAAQPVHSTPLKPQSRETNIDDILNDVKETELHEKTDNLDKNGNKKETSVDDLFSENDKPQTLAAVNQENNSLSYETFVDDLFEGVLPVQSSQLQTSGQNLTSESAIREITAELPARAYSRTAEFDPKPVGLGGVQPVKRPVSINTNINKERSFDTVENSKKSDDPVPKDNIHGVISVRSDGDFDNDLDNIVTDTKEYISKTRQAQPKIGTNYRTANEELEKSNKPLSNINDKDLSNNRNIENTDQQNRENYNSNTESVDTNLLQHIVGIDNRQQLHSNLNNRELEFKDHNANVTLPKSETLNSAIKNPTVGLSPAKNNKYNNGQSDISIQTKFVSSPRQSNSHENRENVPKTGILIDDSLLKSEEEGDVSSVELKIVEDSDHETLRENVNQDENLDSIGSCSLASDDESLNSLEESYQNLQETYNLLRLRGLSESAAGRIIRTPATKPSDIFAKQKDLKGVKRKVHKHHMKKYTSILQSPVTPERVNYVFEFPHRPPSVSRLKVLRSREKFLSSENLSSGNFEDKFLQHRTSLASTPRKYFKRNERHLQSTESLPSDMLAWNTSYGSNISMDGMHSLPLPSPRHFEEMYSSRLSSANTSHEKADIHTLHAHCMFSPEKREEIRHTAKSLENMFEQLLRYGSISSLATETDLDADVSDDVNAHAQSLQDTYYLSFQYPLARAASMSAITGPSESHRLPRKHGKGRFASRHVAKSKSLQTLETNLDEVFAAEADRPGNLSRTPSEHELRVSKSLSKLNVPDWFRKSSFSRSDSTQSLFTYAGRTGSTSTIGSSAYPPSLTTSPCPSVTPGSNAVVIQKRVTPTSFSPAAKLVRAPMLPTTPERAPIHNTPLSLPSDKYRRQDKKDQLKPIAIVPFAKLREMFEKKSRNTEKTVPPVTSVSPVTSPTKEKPKVRFEGDLIQTEISDLSYENKPVQNERTISPPPPLPERKPILSESVKINESATNPKKSQQVHFSDENHVSTKPQEQNTNSVRQNGTSSGTNSSSKSAKKPQSLRASLPMPQFRFRRPGSYAKQAAMASQSSSSQSKKGKEIGYHGNIGVTNEIALNFPQWLHALEHKTKTDGETLFEFLQKRRYSSILENGFSEQLDELQDKNVTFNFPVMTLGRHSNKNGDFPVDGSPDLQVILTNAHAHHVTNGYLQNKLRSDATVDDILDGLLLLDGHRTGRMRIDENGRIVPRTPDGLALTPDTPPGMCFKMNSRDSVPRVQGDINYDENDGINTDYVLVKCKYPECKRETNLKEARNVFKSCHSCFTYYCSRDCRKLHWEAHKQVCIYSKINSACKHVIKFINRQPHLQYQCSRIARRGYLSQGRGCVVFAFPDISSSEDFLLYGMESLWVPPVYISQKELPHATMLGSKLGILTDTCKQYNPELKYVIHVAIVIPPKLPAHPVPRRMEAIIQKCAKLRLSPAHMHPKQENSDIPSTLILTAVPGNQHTDDNDGRKTRELCFVNIQRKLRNRGVSLRHHFPDVYNRLIDFVADAKHFSPLIIYPCDNRTGRKFMCVIMPEAEPEIEWIRDPDLFHELDVFDDDATTDLSTSNLSVFRQQEIML